MTVTANPPAQIRVGAGASSVSLAAFTPAAGTLFIVGVFTLPGSGSRILPAISDTFTNGGLGSTWERLDRYNILFPPSNFPGAERKWWTWWGIIVPVSGNQSGVVTATAANCQITITPFIISNPLITSTALANCISFPAHFDLGAFHATTRLWFQEASVGTVAIMGGITAGTAGNTVTDRSPLPALVELHDGTQSSISFPGDYCLGDLSPYGELSWNTSNHSMLSGLEILTTDSPTPNPGDIAILDEKAFASGTGVTSGAITQRINGRVFHLVSLRSQSGVSFRTCTNIGGTFSTGGTPWTKRATLLWDIAAGPQRCEMTLWEATGTTITPAGTIVPAFSNNNLGTGGSVIITTVEVAGLDTSQGANANGIIQIKALAEDGASDQEVTFDNPISAPENFVLAFFAAQGYTSAAQGVFPLQPYDGLERLAQTTTSSSTQRHALNVWWRRSNMDTPGVHQNDPYNVGTIAIEFAGLALGGEPEALSGEIEAAADISIPMFRRKRRFTAIVGLLDENGFPILDENGDPILDESSNELSLRASASVTGDLTLITRVNGSAAAASGASAELRSVVPLAGSVTAAASIAGVFRAQGEMNAVVTAAAVARGTLRSTVKLLGRVAASSSFNGTSRATVPLISKTIAASGTTANLFVELPSFASLLGTIEAAVTTTAELSIERRLIGAVTGAVSIPATLRAAVPLIGVTTASALFGETFIGTVVSMEATGESAADFTGDLEVISRLFGVIAAASGITAAPKFLWALKGDSNTSAYSIASVHYTNLGLRSVGVRAAVAVHGSLRVTKELNENLFLLAEDEALKAKLQGLTVVDARNAQRPVGVWFRWPEAEFSDKLFPFITIDLLDITFDVPRAHSYNWDQMDYLPDQVAASDPSKDFFSPFPVTCTIFYVVRSHCRSAQHNRQLTRNMLNPSYLPLRFGRLLVPTDNTYRSLDIVNGPTTTVRMEPETMKRDFMTTFTISVNAELLPEEAYEAIRAQEVIFEQVLAHQPATLKEPAFPVY